MIWYIHTQKPYPATMITASTGARISVRNKKTVSSRFLVGESTVSVMIRCRRVVNIELVPS